MEIVIIFLSRSHEQQSCKRKVRYGHKDTAERAKAKMEKKHAKRFDAYECEYCGGWHLGTSWEE